MSVIKFNRNFSTLFSWDTDENPTTEQDYQNAVKNWTETEMNIVDTLLWQPTTEYATGNIVKTPSLPSQYVLRCAEAGTSGSTEPSYSGASAGDTVTDGTVEWVIVSLVTGNAADVDASNIGVNAEVDNSEAWASAIGGGAIAEDDGRLVKGDTVYAVTSVMETNIAMNSEAIEENAENIATNTETIAQHTTDIDIAEKRIGNIEKLLQGNLYDYQTDSDSAYTKTVPTGAMPYASLDSIGGKTLVWNQLRIGFDRTNTADGITTSYNSTTGLVTITNDSRTTNYSNGSNQVILMSGDTIPSGHKFVITTDADTTGLMMTFSSPSINLNVNTILTASASYTSGYLRVTKDYDFVTAHPIGDVYSFHVNIVDLTLMYGSGNEPATYNDFVATFPAFVNTNISHNAGTLLSAGVTEVVSKGVNLFDISRFSGVSGITINGSQMDMASANVISGLYLWENTDNNVGQIGLRMDCYYDSASGQGAYCRYRYTDDTTQVCYLSYPSYPNQHWGTYTFISNASKVVKRIELTYGSASIPTSFRNVQVSYGSITDYSAPFSISTPIPASIQALEGYGWSADSVYNYIDYERKVFVKCVDRVDLGTLSWISYATDTEGYSRFLTTSINTVAKKDGNILCAKYMSVPYADTTHRINGINLFTNGNVIIYDDAYATSTATQFTSAMSGVYAFYELQTPVETDISAYITDDNLISVESGGTLSFPNSNGDDYRIPVPSAETFMVDLQSALGE